jgi:hypothetical protein
MLAQRTLRVNKRQYRPGNLRLSFRRRVRHAVIVCLYTYGSYIVDRLDLRPAGQRLVWVD